MMSSLVANNFLPLNHMPHSKLLPIVDTKIEDEVTWVAWRSDDTGEIFRAPSNWSKHQACDYAEKIYKDDTFDTVHQL